MCPKRDPILKPKRALGGADCTYFPLWADKADQDAPEDAQVDPKGTKNDAQGDKRGPKMRPEVPTSSENLWKNGVPNPEKNSKIHNKVNFKFCGSGPLYFNGFGSKFAGRVPASQLWCLRN